MYGWESKYRRDVEEKGSFWCVGRLDLIWIFTKSGGGIRGRFKVCLRLECNLEGLVEGLFGDGGETLKIILV